MDDLIVLYDSACSFCVSCRRFLEACAQHDRLNFLCCRSAVARERYGRIGELTDELVVIDSSGRYWVGPPAFLMCLWALVGGRLLASLLSTALLWPLTRLIFQSIADSRGALSGLFGPACEGQHCAVPPRRAPYR